MKKRLLIAVLGITLMTPGVSYAQSTQLISLSEGKRQARDFARRVAYQTDADDWSISSCFRSESGYAVYCRVRTYRYSADRTCTCTLKLKVTRERRSFYRKASGVRCLTQ